MCVCVCGEGVCMSSEIGLMLKLIFAVHFLKYFIILFFIYLFIFIIILFIFTLILFSLLPHSLSPFLSQMFDMIIKLKSQKMDIDGCQVVFKAPSLSLPV